MANPTRLRWNHDHLNTDGSAFTAAQFAGYEVEINGEGAVSVPAGYDADGQYELPLANLAAVQETGTYSMRLRVVNNAGNPSGWSNPVSFAMDFRVPTAPTGLSVG